MTPTAFPRRSGRAVAIVIALSAALAACNRDADAPSAAAGAATGTTAAATTAARFDARLDLVNNNGVVRFDGTVDSDPTRQRIIHALQQAYGAASVSGDLHVDPGARPAPWLGRLPEFLQAFSTPGAAVGFSGQRIELSGHASRDDRVALLARAERLYPGFDFEGLFRGVGTRTAAPNALSQVQAGASAQDVVQALNRTPIQFEDGSARVSADSLALLSQAADAIRNGSAARIEIAGPADAGGDVEEGRQLSQQRAEAIKVQLIVNGVSPAVIETAPQSTPGHQASFRLLK